MSDIGNRLEVTASEDVTLNAFVFGSYVMAFIVDDATAAQARNRMNDHITENGGSVLTSAEETNIQSMKTHYNGLATDAQHEYRDKLIAYAQQLQDGRITVAQWDSLMGL